jgi:ubiquinone/menaquinone biosynthesis C-methylase UbiE
MAHCQDTPSRDATDASGERPPGERSGRSSPTTTAHHDFSDVARWLERFESAERIAWQKSEHVVARLEIEPGMTVVDLGTGTGFFLPLLAAAVGPAGRVVALDLEPNFVRFVSARARQEKWTNVEVRQSAADDPALENDSVDRVLTVNTWHHLEARSRYAARLRAALRPQGRFMVVEFTRESPHGPPPAARVSPEQVSSELAAAGFAATLCASSLPHQYIVVARPTTSSRRRMS